MALWQNEQNSKCHDCHNSCVLFALVSDRNNDKTQTKTHYIRNRENTMSIENTAWACPRIVIHMQDDCWNLQR